ncbi:ATP-dependent helicase [Sporosarcina sp. Te-1]|uniref:ATP-dependent helicase n=1 Tax=Sporosarcina sp. Te-1 TaxID=2818390 RepID=UPI001A9F886A|nr:ATP-dependent helicase [Sporosarcina sp. Te-1]QTD42650.1 ATP-dependent helicase [Sporosarcina sp. Te-1]
MYDFFERKKRELGIELNEVQKKAVMQTEGPLLLLACPGSGKTTTMIMRIGYLLEEKKVPASRLKAITFSRASARDMAERYEKFFPGHPPIDFSTIHSLAFLITRTYLKKTGTSYELLEGNKKERAMLTKSSIIKELYRKTMREEGTEDDIQALLTFISFLKNRMIPHSEWEHVKGPFHNAGAIAMQYEQRKSMTPGHLLLDFDDMLTIAEQALRCDQKLAELFRSRYDYMLTDESQDTSLVQHKIIEHLVKHHANLCVVADDDQSIYTWRGADPDYLLDFQQVYPDMELLKMERNYRSSKEIVEVSSEFIKRNKMRYDKTMHTINDTAGPVVMKQFESPKEQLEYVTYEVLNEKNLSEVAILFRNNSSSTLYVNELHRRGIPFYMKDADDKFFSHWIVEDILNFMRLSFNVERKDIFAKVIMKMNVFVSRHMVNHFVNTHMTGNVFESFIQSTELKRSQVEKLERYQEIYDKMSSMRPAQVIRMIRYELEYEEALKSRAEKFGYRIESLLGILDTLESIASQVRTMVEFANRLKELENAVAEAKYNPKDNAVTLSTFHSAKGLEFSRVFLIDLVKGIIPSEEDELEISAMEEARRLFYVGMTRAKRKLELLSYRAMDGKTKEDSKFLNEVRGILMKSEETKKPQIKKADLTIPLDPDGVADRDELADGMIVTHRVFGRGVIESIGAEDIQIRFGDTVKRLSLETILSRRLLKVMAV